MIEDRQRLYRLLGVGQRDLGMSEESLRILLARHGAQVKDGKPSRTTMTISQLNSALTEMVEKGFKVKPPKRAGKKPRNFNRLPLYADKVEALLADMGLSWAYADTIARNITGGNGGRDKDPGVERLAWVKRPEHWRAIIAALDVEQTKRVRLAQVQELIAKLGLTEADVEALIEQRGIRVKNWRRAPNLLGKLVDYYYAQVEQREAEGGV